MRLLYYAPLSRGGIAEYSHRQADALAHLGVDVTLLCPTDDDGPWHRVELSGRSYRIQPLLYGYRTRALPTLIRKALFVRDIVSDARTLAAVAKRECFSRVLFAAYNENFAPLWAEPLRRLSRERGTVFGAVIHDPVRARRFGPLWWHRWSMAASYSTLREAFVHSPMTLDTARPMMDLRTTVIPHGLYETSPFTTSRADWRARHGIPPGARVMLAFGFIRDDKNLDLVLRAMPRFGDLHLLVAGAEQSGMERGIEFYRALAGELGVSKRCHWLARFVRNDEIGDIFNAADLLLLTYQARFRSASGVINMGASHRIPCLASGGDGNLRYIVQKYRVGAWVEPDSLDALAEGLQNWLDGAMPQPDWEGYTRDNSWQHNAQIVAEKMDVLGCGAA